MTRKQTIPKAVREQCWLTTVGKNMNVNVIFLGVKIL